MSVTPTDAALIVALDFEGSFNSVSLAIIVIKKNITGVHSIERSTLGSRGHSSGAFQHGNFESCA
jgi:hypothetical protein